MSKRPGQSAAASWRPMLEARPLPNAAARAEPRGDGVVVRVPHAPSPLRRPPLSWFVPSRPFREVALDRLGAEVWHACDGRSTVEAIIDAFAAHHRLSFHEARVAVTSYLGALIKRGILAIALEPSS